MPLLKLTKIQLMADVINYFTSEVEACPLNAAAFVETIFSKYTVEEGQLAMNNDESFEYVDEKLKHLH